MIAIITNDYFLYEGFKSINTEKQVLRFDNIRIFNEYNITPNTLIVDILCGEGLSLSNMKYLEKVNAEKILILSPFKASRIDCVSPVYFLDRKASPSLVQTFIKDKTAVDSIKTPSFSIMQIEVARLFHAIKDEKSIAQQLGISYGTLRIHKYNLMLKLKLRKMCHVVHTDFFKYISDTETAIDYDHSDDGRILCSTQF